MSTAARQLAPFLVVHPFPTRTLYLLLVLVRRVVNDYGITQVIPELDVLVEHTIARSRQERLGARMSHPTRESRATVLARQIAPHLLHLQRRLDQHRSHPGIEALRQRVFPHGLGHMVGLPPQALTRRLDAVVATLCSPTHHPYIETAGLTTVVHSLAHDHHALQAVLGETQAPLSEPSVATDERLQQELGLLWIRLMAAVWSDHPRHAACRGRLLHIWQRCERHAQTAETITNRQRSAQKGIGPRIDGAAPEAGPARPVRLSYHPPPIRPRMSSL